MFLVATFAIFVAAKSLIVVATIYRSMVQSSNSIDIFTIKQLLEKLPFATFKQQMATGLDTTELNVFLHFQSKVNFEFYQI